MSNRDEIERYRRELSRILGDISHLDERILSRSVEAGLDEARENTPTDTGHLKRSWGVGPTARTPSGVEKELFNTAEYALFVDAGHRVVNKAKETVGFIEGMHMMGAAETMVERSQELLYRHEIERISRQ